LENLAYVHTLLLNISSHPFFLSNLQPGNCLGLIAAKSGPTAVRGQFYGAAAAVGKIGAFVGTWAFPPMIDGTSP